MNQLQIDCFTSVYEYKSIASAAEAMYFSPQAVSQNLNNLEQELGCRLFIRNKGGAVPTPSGKRFYEFTSDLKTRYNLTINSIKEMYNSMAAEMKIGISEYIDPLGFISSGISEFISSHRTTKFSGMQYNNKVILDKLSSKEIDIAIVCDTQTAMNGDLEMLRISNEELQLFISNSGMDEEISSLQNQKLQELCLTLSHVDAPYGIWSSEEWNEISKRMSSFLNISLKNRYVMPNFISVIECARSVKCAIVCDKKFGYLRNYENIPEIPLNTNTSICCIWHKTNEHPLIPEFCNFLKEYYSFH